MSRIQIKTPNPSIHLTSMRPKCSYSIQFNPKRTVVLLLDKVFKLSSQLCENTEKMSFGPFYSQMTFLPFPLFGREREQNSTAMKFGRARQLNPMNISFVQVVYNGIYVSCARQPYLSLSFFFHRVINCCLLADISARKGHSLSQLPLTSSSTSAILLTSP